MPDHPITHAQLADLIEHHGRVLVAALRQGPTASESLAAEHGLDTPEQSALRAESPVTRHSADARPMAPNGSDRTEWRKVGELTDQSYAWPHGLETYDPFEVWELDGIQIGLGRATDRDIYYGKERGYWLAFEMVNGQRRRPIVVFNEADDFDTSGDLVAIIKGKGPGGRSMFASGDELPAGYERLDIDVFRNRINGPQAFNRLAVIAEAGDRAAMCTHAALQLALRSLRR
jgi:hypothetical protein